MDEACARALRHVARLATGPPVDPRLRVTLNSHPDLYVGAGCSVVAQDVVLGPHLQLLVDLVRARPLHVVVLAPRPAVVAERERRRGKRAYGDWTVDGLDGVLRRDTPRLGLWLDTSELTVDQTCDAILARSAEASIGA